MNSINFIEHILTKYLEIKSINSPVIVNEPKKNIHGHLSTNLALIIGKKNNLNPMDVAKEIIGFINQNYKNDFETIEALKPGFINFVLTQKNIVENINDILEKKSEYGGQAKQGIKYNLELISANPTGPLHVGHARNGVIGDAVGRILKFAGYDIVSEYYVNDAGVQINTLALTIFKWYLSIVNNEKVTLSDNCYKGEIYKSVAEIVIKDHNDKFKAIQYNETNILDEQVNQIFKSIGIKFFLDEIKKSIKFLDINIDYYISEARMYTSGLIEKVLDTYRQKKAIYFKDDAWWLKTSEYGDSKDRVLIKQDKTYTYILPDLAGHYEKITRTNPDHLIDFLGADHHGYIQRIKCGLSLLGAKKDILEVDMIQMVKIVKDHKEYKMSKRKGTAVWLSDMLELIGKNSLRYMLCSKAPFSQMELDIDLIKQHSSQNPVFYINYATARCSSVIEKSKKYSITETNKYHLLTLERELRLIIKLIQFPKIIILAASQRLPNLICDYLYNLAKLLHQYYSCARILNLDDIELSSQRLMLIKAVNQIFTNGLKLIGVDFVNKM